MFPNDLVMLCNDFDSPLRFRYVQTGEKIRISLLRRTDVAAKQIAKFGVMIVLDHEALPWLNRCYIALFLGSLKPSLIN